MKKFTVLLVVFSALVLSGNLFAEGERKREISFGGGYFLSDCCSTSFGAASLGYYSKLIGGELSGAVLEGGAILGGNLVLGLFENQLVIPYTTMGIWTTVCGGLGYNVGGGIKIKLSETFAMRAEYRRYFVGDTDWGIDTIIGGISLFF